MSCKGKTVQHRPDRSRKRANVSFFFFFLFKQGVNTTIFIAVLNGIYVASLIDSRENREDCACLGKIQYYYSQVYTLKQKQKKTLPSFQFQDTSSLSTKILLLVHVILTRTDFMTIPSAPRLQRPPDTDLVSR
jgi:hypothetical protein